MTAMANHIQVVILNAKTTIEFRGAFTHAMQRNKNVTNNKNNITKR